MTSCPQCGSASLYKDGLRPLIDGSNVQRWLCRSCGYRFSQSSVKLNVDGQIVAASQTGEDDRKQRVVSGEGAAKKTSDGLALSFGENIGSHVFTTVEKDLNGLSYNGSNRRVCAQEAKNLTEPTTEIKTVGGVRGIDKATAKGLLLQFGLYLDKEGYGKDCRYVGCIRMLLNSNGDVYNPDNIKEVIARKKWKNGTKMQTCYAYDAFARMLGLSWVMPTYRQEEYLFFLPQESELNALISASRSPRMTAYLQCLKETFGDPGEVLGLRWIDVDANRNVIAINKPVKNHRPRELEVSSVLIRMLNALPKTSQLIFPTDYRNIQSTFMKLRKRVAHNLQNPRILSISFVSLRHWGGTQLAWLTNGNVLIVKEKLGHKNVNNTMKYIARIKWKLNQDFDVSTATTDEEIKNLGAAGYEKYDERSLGATTISYCRRPKMFGNVKV